MIEELKSKDLDIRRWSAYCIGRVGPKAASAVPELKKLLKDKEEEVREAAAEALKKIRGAK